MHNTWRRFEDGTGTAQLDGFAENAEAYWRTKWERVTAEFQALVGRFLTLRVGIVRQRERLGVALDRAENRGLTDRAAQLRQALREGDELLRDQQRLENDVQASILKIQEIESDALGFVIVLSVIVGGVVLVGGTAAAIVIHTQMTQKWNRKADLLEQGLISSSDLAGDGDGWIPSWVWLAGLAAAGVAVWQWQK